MSDHVDELIELVKSAGGTVRLYGVPVTARELRSFAWAGFVDRYTQEGIRQALRDIAIGPQPEWSPYP